MSESSLQSSHDTVSTGGVFVGRQRETGELRAALEESIAGHGRLAMLVGEPGIGKTRIAQELASYAKQRGAQVLWGWCYEGEGAPPYWPWIQILRGYLRHQDPDGLRSEMGAGAADIAEIIPEVREKLPVLEPPPALEPEQARFRLFDSITGFLKNAAQSQPLVLVLDDLHWADKPSLLLLQFLAREIGGSRLLSYTGSTRFPRRWLNFPVCPPSNGSRCEDWAAKRPNCSSRPHPLLSRRRNWWRRSTPRQKATHSS